MCFCLCSIGAISPLCFDEDSGLTIFKRVAEYIIIAILISALVVLINRRAMFDKHVWRWLAGAVLITAFSEVSFTVYAHPYSMANVIGHVLKLISFYLVYKALIERGLREPYDLLFRDLKESQDVLRRARDELETRVQERTADLSRAVEALGESEERYRRLVEFSPDGIALVAGRQNPVHQCNRRSTARRTPPQRFRGTQHRGLLPAPPTVQPLRAQLRNLTEENIAMATHELKRLDDQTIHVETSAIPLLLQGKRIGLIIFRDITHRREAEVQLMAYQRQLQSLASELVLAEEKQRRYIAEGLHDDVGQLLAASKIKLGALEKSIGRKDVHPSIAEIRRLVEQAIQYVRTLTFELTPPVLYTLGFEAALEWLADRTSEQHGIRCDFETDGQPKVMSEEIQILLFRAVRELLNNTVKHAAARLAKISVEKANGSIRVFIEDDGIGFDPLQMKQDMGRRGGYGLFSIRERLNYLGGTVKIASGPGRGTRVELMAPLSPEQNSARN